MNNSLFLRLYVSIAAVIIASIILVSLTLDVYNNTTGEADFVADIAFVNEQLSSYEKYHGKEPQHWQTKAQMLTELTGFEIRRLSPAQKQQFTSRHPLLETRDGFDVYEIDEQKLAGLHDMLLITDGDNNPDAQQMNEDFEALFLLAFIFISIALVLYLSVKRIAAQVNLLSQASQALAEGKLATRVDESMPNPLKQMAASFNSMAASLQYSRQQQQTMANAMAHELRTPLTRIQLALGILNEQQHDEFATALHQDITRYAIEMEALADDILTLQSVDHNSTVTAEDFNLTELVRLRQAEFQRLYPHRTITTDLCELSMKANRRYLQLIIDNLVINACKYANSTIAITLQQAEQKCVLIVEDDGQGISPQQRQQILEPFTRLDNSRSRQSGGFGLGLAIVNTIVKKLDGQLSIDSSSTGGAKFVVELNLSDYRT